MTLRRWSLGLAMGLVWAWPQNAAADQPAKASSARPPAVSKVSSARPPAVSKASSARPPAVSKVSSARPPAVASVDARVQESAERWLRKAAPHEGAIVVSDVRTGRIMAWASRGAGDMVARAFAPSASVFKLVTVSTLLDTGKANARSTACYAGGEGGLELTNLKAKRGDLCVSLRTAVGRSINAVIAKLAVEHLRPKDIQRMAGLLGFDGEVPIDRPVGASHVELPGDKLGFARAAAGFWNGRTSALAVLFATQTIANRGVRVQLQTQSKEPERLEQGRALSAIAASELTRMMQMTVQSGTAAPIFKNTSRESLAKVKIAGKTGTLVGDKPARMYSWFTGFAPANRPEIAIVVLLANDPKWKMKGGEVGREILGDYFDRRPSQPK